MDSKEVLHNRHLIIGITTFIEVLGITSYVLRLLARRFSSTALWWDDYIMGMGLVTASIPGICYYVGKSTRPTAEKSSAEKSSPSIRARKTC